MVGLCSLGPRVDSQGTRFYPGGEAAISEGRIWGRYWFEGSEFHAGVTIISLGRSFHFRVQNSQLQLSIESGVPRVHLGAPYSRIGLRFQS